MAIINNSQGLFITLPVNTKYDPTNPGVEDFPTHYDQNGYGGFVAVNSSISEVAGASSLTGKYNLIIPTKRRKDGMMIYDINPEVASFYQCTDATAGFWEEVDFKFRYFYGATAPTAPDIQVGEKWFDTVVGSEYTYLPIADGSSYKAWVDIDHIGEGETFSGYITVSLANTYYVNVGGDEMTGSLTADKVFRSSSDVNFEDDEFVTKSFVFANFTESSGGFFTGHITGTSAVFTQGVTASKYNATEAITENTQLATKQYVDESGINIHINDDTNPFGTEVTAFSISGGSNITIDYDQSTTPNRFVISSTLEVADEFVLKTGDTMSGTLTGTTASFSNSITAPSGFIGTLTGTNASFFGVTATNGFIGTLTGTNASFSNSITAPSGFIGTLTGTNASFTGLTATNGFIGTLTGTNASFTGLTAANGFIGTLTGNNIRYTNAEFGTDSLVIQGSSATFTDMSVMITGDYSFDVGNLSIGLTSYQTQDNPSVPRIQSANGVLIGGTNVDKQNWLGNNAYLTPEGNVFIGIPNDTPTSWFSSSISGATYPFSIQSLNVTGGIHTDRAYRWGNKKGQNTFLDQEFVTKAYVTPDGITGGTGAGFAIIPCSRPNTNKDDYIMVSYIPHTLTVDSWITPTAAGQVNYFTNEGTVSLPIDNYPTINSIVGTVYNNSVIFTMSVKITDINQGSFKYRVQVGRLTGDSPTSGNSEISSVLVNFVVTSN